VLQGADRGRRFDLIEESIQIGRGVQSDLRIHDTEVSRHHAELRQIDGRWQVADVGSSNGTFVNGRQIDSALLSAGDQIQFGRSVLLFNDAHGVESSIHLPDVELRHDPDDASQIISQLGPGESSRFKSPAGSGGSFNSSLASIQALNQITDAVVQPFVSLDQLLQQILNVTIHAIGADRGCMFVADPQTDELVPRIVGFRESEPDGETKIPVSRTIVEYVVQQGQGVRTSDAIHDARFVDGQSILKAGIREAMCVPMRGRYELLGVIYVDTTSKDRLPELSQQHHFQEESLALLVAVGRQSALAVENNRYQEALVSSERLAAIGQTVAGLGHDVKNILQGLRGGSALIDMGLKDANDELVRNGWGIVERNQERIYHLVMDMLSFSKDRRPELEPGNLNQTVADVVELLTHRAQEAGVEFDLSEMGEVPLSQFDPNGIHRAVLNVISNALDAVEEQDSPRVTIATGYRKSHDQLWITIKDNGPGIPTTELPSLFNLFESAKVSRGTGLGLAVSRKILREHGGDITVTSPAGEGAAFRLEWPFQAVPAASDDSHLVESQTQK